ncbi:DNA-directed RNA polymerase subunit omega [bacterium]|jgi:DNA-directed RNA polymerase subunit K/omega|nr:DNA-directed RNA polymerase subunit omega [bacterium]
MEKVSYDNLPEGIGSHYELIILAAKRAQALSDGARPLVENTRKRKHIDIALEEIKKGKIVNAAKLGKQKDIKK